MAYCRHCGKEFENESKKFCSACGAPRQGTSERTVSKPVHAPTTHRKKRLWIPVLIIVLVVAVGLGAGCGYLGWKSSPARFLRNLNDTLIAQDVPELRSTFLAADGYEISSDKLRSLCAVLSAPEEWTDFRKHLEQQISGGEGDAAFSAFQVERSPALTIAGFSLFQSYTIRIRPVEIVVSTNVDDVLLSPDDEGIQIERRDDGDFVITAPPGEYVITGQIPADYSNVQVQTEPILSLSVQPSQAALIFSVFDIAVDCGDVTDMTVYINNIQTDLRPEGHTVKIPYAENGMVVRAEARRNGVGATSELVVREESDSYAFDFGIQKDRAQSIDPQKVPESNMLDSDRMILETLYLYYTTYLDCLNEQSPSKLQRVTDGYDITEWINDNKQYIFSFSAVIIDLDSYSVGNDTKIEINVQFQYAYCRRNTSQWTDRKSTQKCYLVYDESANVWLIEDITINDAMVLSDNQIILN